ncbi:MAG TPA: carbamoyl phosphate synthase large subunit [Elusimicrobia bacterium]|nr:carbamoyl phosphate synthase large subunit [Elusimicrobiota bacterium]HBT61096.1 carbamoyl phosphate synthase large subunit [Elusimicrobiota bacterium]
MPKRSDIRRILVIGSGPIVIGQACEFDYSGTQALKALKAEGYEVVLANSNPATIMTDPGLAQRTYIEPLNADYLEKILERERPQAVLPTIGGQTALNLAVTLAERGILKRLGVELLGAPLEVIRRAEDRQLFKAAMQKIGLSVPRSQIATDIAQAESAARELGFPVIIRPSFTLGGTGGGIAYNLDELVSGAAAALAASPVKKVLLEESVLGWKEYELEVMRDRKDNFVVICSIENLDPMGVHTGDSITVAPAQTLSDREYQAMRDDAKAAVSAVGVETGGCNVQFAVEPRTGRRVIIEINPRVSRSSALASKATGFPIAKIATMLAVGYTLDEIPNDITRKTPACFEPAIDYVVTKVPRFAFEKFYAADEPSDLGPAMKSVGEVMAIGRTFKESLQKALRGLEAGRDGFDSAPGPRLPLAQRREKLLVTLAAPRPDRIFWIKTALKSGLCAEEIAEASSIDLWFVAQMAELVDFETRLRREKLDCALLRQAKALGFSDRALARLLKQSEARVRGLRRRWKIRPGFKLVDTCAAEFPAHTPYFYSTYEGGNETRPSRSKRKIAILGSGPNRIGQGIEFDYSCVHACQALREAGFETLMINCNPETVSTDYDTSDRLYFEPLTLEDTLEVLDLERPSGVIVQFGGQTPLNLTLPLARAGVKILGTPPSAIDAAEDRRRFGALLKRLGVPAPAHGIAASAVEALRIARRIGYPVMARPSYVLGGRSMEIVYDEAGLRRYAGRILRPNAHPSLLIDRFLCDAAEVDVDAVCDGQEVYIGGVMEHIEEAGIHSGDSSCTLPPHSLTPEQIETVLDYTRRLARGLRVRGLINIQFAIKDNVVYVLEANPRASRTVPFISKATGVPLAKLAARVMVGAKLKSLLPRALRTGRPPALPYAAMKEVVLPFNRFPGVDPRLGPEMKSTGEVMGIDRDFPRAFIKSQAAAGTALPVSGAVFISVRDEDKSAVLPIASALRQMGFALHATKGTHAHLERHGISTKRVFKIGEGKPDPVDLLRQRAVTLVINTPSGGRAQQDGFAIRRTSLDLGVTCITNLNDCRVAVHGIGLLRESKLEVKSLQEHHGGLSYPVPG